MFYYITPQEVIEGYSDPLITQLGNTPIYLAGDQLTNPFLSLNIDPTAPANNEMAFF